MIQNFESIRSIYNRLQLVYDSMYYGPNGRDEVAMEVLQGAVMDLYEIICDEDGEKKSFETEVGVEVRERRVAAKKTLKELAASVGVSECYISQIETGARRPSVETAKKIAAVLGFDWTRFYEEQDSA